MQLYFKKKQVRASSYSDYSYWNNLPSVTNRNVSGDSDYIFNWDEVKEQAINYIYMITPEPCIDFFRFRGKKIKIKNIGGLSGSKKLYIALGIDIPVVVIIIIIVIIICYRMKKRYQNVVYNVQIKQQQPIPQQIYPQSYYAQTVIPQNSYSQTGYPQPIYQQPIPIQPIFSQPVNPQYLNPEPNFQIKNSPPSIYTPQDNMPSSALNRLNYQIR